MHESGDTVGHLAQIEAIQKGGRIHLHAWLKSIGYEGGRKLLLKDLRIKDAAIAYRVNSHPKAFVATVFGLVLLQKEAVRLDEQIKSMQATRFPAWLEYVAEFGKIEELEKALGIKRSSISTRKRKDPKQLIAAVYGLKIVR